MKSDIKDRYGRALEWLEKIGKGTLEWFEKGTEIEWKSDQSPVTIADKEAELGLRESIAQFFPMMAFWAKNLATGQDLPGLGGSSTPLMAPDPLPVVSLYGGCWWAWNTMDKWLPGLPMLRPWGKLGMPVVARGHLLVTEG